MALKSLEIVNKEIEDLTKRLENVEDDNKDEGRIVINLTKVLLLEKLEKANIIKQNLEILEIIKKILIRIEYVDYKDTKQHCFVVNKFVENKDIEKLKQWLEENE